MSISTLKIPKTITPLDIKYRYRGIKGSYMVEFSIGVQTFTVAEVESIQEVRWWHKSIHFALCNMLQAWDQKKLLFYLKTTKHIYHVTKSKTKKK